MNLIHFVMDALMYCLTKSSLNCCEQCNRFNGAAYALVFYKFMEESDCELFMKGVNDILHKEYNKKHPFTPPPVDSADEED